MTFYPNTKKRISVSNGAKKEPVKIKGSSVKKPSADYLAFRLMIITSCDVFLKREISNEERQNIIRLRNNIELNT